MANDSLPPGSNAGQETPICLTCRSCGLIVTTILHPDLSPGSRCPNFDVYGQPCNNELVELHMMDDLWEPPLE